MKVGIEASLARELPVLVTVLRRNHGMAIRQIVIPMTMGIQVT